jgi:hypothetical protein
MSKLFDKHIELVKLVNSADSERQHQLAEERLRGFRDCMDVKGYQQLMDCDMYYIEKGIDRPMCCGVFLDWKPAV